MLTLKLQRIGKKHQAAFRLIVGEKREKLNGKQLEDLGWYNPRTDKYEFNKARVLHWISKGAQKTDTVHNALVNANVIEGKKIAVHKQPKKNPASADSSAKASATAEATAGKGGEVAKPANDVSAIGISA
ncbi:MAG: 30S ribosomal protein S16 [Candidatus Harrisonbacteria bacterium]|nr:30S ribosomal protein S16 [Candidatus Harrisonbacteria bacterium]